MTTYCFVVPGIARPKKRPRVTRHGTYTPDPHKYVPLVAGKAREAGLKPCEGPVVVSIVVYRGFPKARSKVHRQAMWGKPCLLKVDGVNILANYWDAMIGIAYRDDSQVYRSDVSMYWAEEHYVNVTVKQEGG
jgi:Holliday junction resolvase RusA-like endonuclease